jgi:ketosteroid isomerase-like protein
MKSTDELRHEELARRAEEFRSASQDRDVERMLALFADDAEVTMAPGTFRGKAAIRKFFEWEMRMAPVATSNDTGLGMVVVGRSVVWECQISETAQGVPYTTDAVRILEFDDTGLIRRYRSYYDKLAVMEKIASGLSGVYGWLARALIGYLVAQGRKGLDISLVRPAA